MSNYNNNIPERVNNLFSENYTQPTEPETIQDYVSETLSTLTEALNYRQCLHLTGTDQKFYQRFSTMDIPEDDKQRVLIASFKLILDDSELILNLESFFNEHPDLTTKEFSQILERIGNESWTQKGKCKRLIELSPLLQNIPSIELPSITERVDNMDPGQRDIACEIVKEIPKSEKSTQFINTLCGILKNCQTIYDEYSDDDFAIPDPPPRDVKDALMTISKDKWLKIFLFFDKVDSPYNPVDMIKLIANTPSQQREIIYKLLPDKPIFSYIIKKILSTPSNIRDPFITCLAAQSAVDSYNESVLKVFFTTIDDAQRQEIVKIIKAIPSEEVTLQIITLSLKLFRFFKLEEDDFRDFIDDDSLYLSDHGELIEHSELAKQIHSILSSTPESERASLLTLLSKSEYSTPQESVSCLEELARFSQDQKELLLSIFGPTYKKIHIELLKNLNQQQNLERFLKEIQSKTENYPTKNTHRQQIISYLLEQPHGRWIEYLDLLHMYNQSKPWKPASIFKSTNIDKACSVLNHASNFVKQHQIDSAFQIGILDCTNQTSEDEIHDVLSTTSKLKGGVDFNENAHELIIAIREIPFGSRESFLKEIESLLTIYTKSSDRRYLIEAFANTEPEDYKKVVQAILPLINKQSPIKLCGKLIAIASLLPTSEQNTETIDKIEKLYEDSNKDYVKDSFWLSSTISYYPRHERTLKAIKLKLELSEIFSKHYIDIPQPHRNIENVKILGSILKEISDDDRITLSLVLGKLPFENPELNPLIYAEKLVQTNSLHFFLNTMHQLTNEQIEKLMGSGSQENLRKQVEGFLLINLEESITDMHKSRLLSRQITNLIENGLFSEDSILFQRAMEIAIDTDPAAQNDPLNPYVFHQNLLKTISEEELIDIPQSGSTPWNVTTLREKARQKAYTFADLPPNVQNSTLTNLFQNLEKRIGDDKTNQDYIEESQGVSYSNLKANLLNKPLILSLCNSAGQPTEKIDVAKFQLFSILSVILENSPTKIAHGSPLTEREEMLLSFSNSVNNCSVGQRGGIADYFNSLNAVFNAADSDRVTSYVDASVQKLILNAISEERLLEKLGCPRDHQGAIAQAAHQIAYILARYHKQIGVPHYIFFDRHPRIISSSLISMPPEAILKIIFEHITIDKMIDRLCKDIANKFEQSNRAQERYMKAKAEVHTLRAQGHKEIEEAKKIEKEAKENWDAQKGRDINYSILSDFLTGEGDLTELILFDEDTYEPIGLTEKGALTILKKIGYIS